MISYAQNGEDVLLNRFFAEQATGFYVDIGAGHPWVDSVTCHFYLKGWHGINVEPRPHIVSLLKHWRPLDILEDCGISDYEGETDFFEIDAKGKGIGDGGGLSTFDEAMANQLSKGRFKVTRHKKRVMTLAALMEKNHVKAIDFLKVDVEGHEAQVIKSGDWNRWRPRVVVVEAIKPDDHTDSTGPWKPFLLEQGYLEAGFDGINRYLVREEDRGLAHLLASPVSVLDRFTTWQTHLQAKYLQRKYGPRWKRKVATNHNVPSGLQPMGRAYSLIKRLVQGI